MPGTGAASVVFWRLGDVDDGDDGRGLGAMSESEPCSSSASSRLRLASMCAGIWGPIALIVMVVGEMACVCVWETGGCWRLEGIEAGGWLLVGVWCLSSISNDLRLVACDGGCGGFLGEAG